MFGIQIKKIYQEGLATERIEEETLELMRTLAENRYAKVKAFHFRTAYSYDMYCDLDRKSMLPLEYMLAIKAGAHHYPDDCIVYEVFDGCKTFYVLCSGERFTVSKSIELE